MAVSAETLFNDLGARYEDAFAHDPILCSFIQRIAEKLPQGSQVLDVGCGTGKPVSHILETAGHTVHGIDTSAEMVRLAASQVPGTFERSDMREYKPAVQMDAVFAILSLFQLTPGDIVSMVYKFAEWVRVGGFVALAVLPSTALAPQKVVYDPTWDAVWMMDKKWMGSVTNESFFSEQGWAKLLREAGFVLHAEPVSYLFSPAGENHIPEAHYLLLARRVEEKPLLGPFPWPVGMQNQVKNCYGEANILIHNRVISEDLENLLVGLLSEKRGLYLGQDHWLQALDEVQYHTGSLNKIPLSTGSVDIVLAPWRLHNAVDIEATLAEMARVSSSQVLLIQGAPDNEVVKLINSVARSMPVSHQGHLLHLAGRFLAKYGFSDITLQRIPAAYVFPEKDVAQRYTVAAELLAGLWHQEDPQHEEIKEILGHRLELLFQGHEHTIGFDLVALVATCQPI